MDQALTEGGHKKRGRWGSTWKYGAAAALFPGHRLDDPLTAADVPSDRFIAIRRHYIIEFQHHGAILQPLVDFLEGSSTRLHLLHRADGNLLERRSGAGGRGLPFRRARLVDRGFPDFFDARASSPTSTRANS
jgi:hypothetical protein